ncbi:MAG: hypothetical protein R2741_09960 [Methanolobus sp.]
MARTKYHESLDILKNDVMDMGKLAQDAINNSIIDFKEPTGNLLQQ